MTNGMMPIIIMTLPTAPCFGIVLSFMASVANRMSKSCYCAHKLKELSVAKAKGSMYS